MANLCSANGIAPWIFLAGLLCQGLPAQAAPRIPDSDSAVLERLPIRMNDPAGRALRALRDAVAANPRDRDAALKLARRYFDLASAEGDPRYIGYADAVIRPWSTQTDPPADIVLMRALLQQYRHEFGSAMADLDQVLSREPRNTEAMSWKMALHLVQADYEQARKACSALAANATRLASVACQAVIDSINGKSGAAYAELESTLARNPPQSEEFRQWVLTRLGEMALRAGNKALAERQFRAAIAVGLVDGFVLAAYADLLLDEKRPAEVLALLRDWTSSDILLLRLALAAHAAGAPEAKQHVQTLADRFAAAAQRGDRLHLQEEARFELSLRDNPVRALQLAQEDWQIQREPRDARFLMEAALAARNPAAAKPALEWMARTGYEDPLYRRLAAALAGGKP